VADGCQYNKNLRDLDKSVFGGSNGRLYLISVCTNNEDRNTRAVTGDGAEPEVKAGMLVAQSNVPRQNVHAARRQEKLHIIPNQYAELRSGMSDLLLN
jgi:hypothetical protein